MARYLDVPSIRYYTGCATRSIECLIEGWRKTRTVARAPAQNRRGRKCDLSSTHVRVCTCSLFFLELLNGNLWLDAHSSQFQPIFFKFFIPCSGNISLESITEARILNIQELVALEHAQCSATPRYSKILYFIDLATKSTWCNRDKSYDSNAYKITQFELFVVELWLAQVSASETAHFDEFHTPTNYFANSNKTTHEGR